MEFLWALVAFAGVVVLGTLKGILVAIIVSLVALSYQAAHPRVYALGRKPGTDVFRALSAEHPEDETFPGLLMVRPEGRIFFANAQWVGDQIAHLAEAASPRVLALKFSAVSDIEYSALKMLIEGEQRLREHGILSGWWDSTPMPWAWSSAQPSGIPSATSDSSSTSRWPSSTHLSQEAVPRGAEESPGPTRRPATGILSSDCPPPRPRALTPCRRTLVKAAVTRLAALLLGGCATRAGEAGKGARAEKSPRLSYLARPGSARGTRGSSQSVGCGEYSNRINHER